MARSPKRRIPILWLCLISLVLWAIMVMPPVTLLAWFFAISAWKVVLWSLLITPLLAGWALHVFRGASHTVRWLTMQYLGVTAVLLPFVVFGSVATLWLEPRSVAVIVSLCWLIALAIGILSVVRVREHKLELTSDKLDKPYRLVQLSDVHVGSRSARFLDNLVAQALRHQPDVVVITGDLLDLDHVDESLLTGLKAVSCPVFLCIGKSRALRGSCQSHSSDRVQWGQSAQKRICLAWQASDHWH